MANIVGLHQVTRLLDVTGKSEKNIEDWENPLSNCEMTICISSCMCILVNRMIKFA